MASRVYVKLDKENNVDLIIPDSMVESFEIKYDEANTPNPILFKTNDGSKLWITKEDAIKVGNALIKMANR